MNIQFKLKVGLNSLTQSTSQRDWNKAVISPNFCGRSNSFLTEFWGRPGRYSPGRFRIYGELYLEYSEWELQVSSSKTEYLAANTNASIAVMMNDNVKIKQVQ